MADEKRSLFPYLHGFNREEQQRLYRQAEFTEQSIYRDVDFSEATEVLEVGSGVGAQSAILLRRFPKIRLTGIDVSEVQLKAAAEHMKSLAYAEGRYTYQQMDAQDLSFSGKSFDGAFLCWVLEHVKEPARILGEVRRVLRPGARVYITEVMNSAFFLDPYSPNTWKYWMAFNDYQYDNAGDPFIGAKLGNLLQSVGFRKVRTRVKTWHLDNRKPEKRRQAISEREELLLSAADPLIKANYIDAATVEGMKKELESIRANPNAILFDAFMQASAEVGID